MSVTAEDVEGDVVVVVRTKDSRDTRLTVDTMIEATAKLMISPATHVVNEVTTELPSSPERPGFTPGKPRENVTPGTL